MRISVRHAQSSVKHQYDRPTCVAFAVTALHEHAYDVSTGLPKAEIDLSEEFLYYHCKRRDGLGASAAGTTVLAASASLATEGQSLETLWPYITAPYAAHAKLARPSSPALADAKGRIFSTVKRLPKSISNIQQYLNADLPLVAILDLYSNAYLTRTGKLEMPQGVDRLLGRHAVLIVELQREPSKTESSITFKNSWGVKWGDNGFGSISFEYFETWTENSGATISKGEKTVESFY